MNTLSPISHQHACTTIDQAAAAKRLPVERVAITQAHGRITATPVIAHLAQPPFDNAAMDGFAFRHADLALGTSQRLTLIGEQFAGVAQELRVGPGQCVRITTGAPLPHGADTVIMKEHTHLDGQTVVIDKHPVPGQNVRHRGEDSIIGDTLLQTGEPLTPARIALVAAQGLAELTVSARPTVAVFATGDELVEPGLPLQPGQIYNSNREQLMGLLHAEGLQPTAWPTLADDPSGMLTLLGDAAKAFDIIITCGGVSAGEKDLLPHLLREHADILFWKVQIKPGMPVLFARGGRLGPALLLCLPGNPVSVLATFLVYGRRLLDGLQGRLPQPGWYARLSAPWNKRHPRLEFLRGRLLTDDTGRLHVTPHPADGSHCLRAAADSNSLIVLAEGARDYPAGTVVEVLPYA